MDAWQRSFDQMRVLLRGLPLAQRVSLSVVGVGFVAVFAWLVYSSARPTDEFLLGGKTFSTSELAQTQSVLKAAGLTQFKVTGQRISVPASEVDRYTAAALAQQTLPAQFAAEFDRMQAKVNVFTSSEQRRELLEEARKARLSQILRSIPEIEEAVVEWDRPRQVNLFRPSSQLAAHVSVKPRHGHELSPELVQSLKLFVAGALAGAQPDDVTVVDMNTTRVYGRRSPADIEADRLQKLVHDTEARYTSQIERALRDIPDLLITVKVEEEFTTSEPEERNTFPGSQIVPVSHRSLRRDDAQYARSSRQRSRNTDAVAIDSATVTTGSDIEERASTTLTRAVHVTVSIPDRYYAAVATERGVGPGQSLETDSAYRGVLASIKAETQRMVRARLARLLPRDHDPSAISVITHAAPNAKTVQAAVAPAPATHLAIAAAFDDWRTSTSIAVCGSCVLFVLLRRRSANPEHSPLANSESASIDEMPAPAVAPSQTVGEVLGEYPDVGPNPHASVLTELAELERRAPSTTVSQRHTPFDFLSDLTADAAAQLLRSEHPQTIALVATALSPTDAANILHALPESLRWDVSQRLTRIGPVANDVLGEVAAGLKSRLQATSNETASEPDGSPAERPTAPFILQNQPIQATAPGTIEAGPLTFDDLAAFDTRSLVTLLESIDPRACALALLDRSNGFKQALFAKLPKQMVSAVRQCSMQLGPIRIVEIAAAQQAIAGVAWTLCLRGMIAPPAHVNFSQ